MFNKLYEKTKSLIKENSKFILFLIIILFISIFKLPFYIDSPGGIINVNDKVSIENSNKINGSINLSYVAEMRVTIPTYLFSLINKDYDIIPVNDTKYDNETIQEAVYRSDILLKESINNATILAYEKANKEINVLSSQIYVTYIDEYAQTNLKVGDQIIKINNQYIDSKNRLYELISKYKENDTIKITVSKDYKEYEKTATLNKSNDRIVIGILVSEIYDFETYPKITYNFDSSETGPSGGLMLSLAIYDYLSDEDIIKGKIVVGTGTIEKDGTVGSIGGVKYKLKGAVKNKADIFIAPAGENYEEVVKLVEENNYDIKIIKADTFDDVIEQLRKN